MLTCSVAFKGTNDDIGGAQQGTSNILKYQDVYFKVCERLALISDKNDKDVSLYTLPAHVLASTGTETVAVSRGALISVPVEPT